MKIEEDDSIVVRNRRFANGEECEETKSCHGRTLQWPCTKRSLLAVRQWIVPRLSIAAVQKAGLDWPTARRVRSENGKQAGPHRHYVQTLPLQRGF